MLMPELPFGNKDAAFLFSGLRKKESLNFMI